MHQKASERDTAKFYCKHSSQTRKYEVSLTLSPKPWVKGAFMGKSNFIHKERGMFRHICMIGPVLVSVQVC